MTAFFDIYNSNVNEETDSTKLNTLTVQLYERQFYGDLLSYDGIIYPGSLPEGLTYFINLEPERGLHFLLFYYIFYCFG